MSRKLFAFLLSELGTVRIICRAKECGAVTEVSIARMRVANGECPVCKGDLVPAIDGHPLGGNPLTRLAAAIQELQAHAGKVGVEFVLPDKTGE